MRWNLQFQVYDLAIYAMALDPEEFKSTSTFSLLEEFG